jgi:hypothetical protein
MWRIKNLKTSNLRNIDLQFTIKIETIINVGQVHDLPYTSMIMIWKTNWFLNGISIKHFLTSHSNEETNTKNI